MNFALRYFGNVKYEFMKRYLTIQGNITLDLNTGHSVLCRFRVRRSQYGNRWVKYPAGLQAILTDSLPYS